MYTLNVITADQPDVPATVAEPREFGSLGQRKIRNANACTCTAKTSAAGNAASSVEQRDDRGKHRQHPEKHARHDRKHPRAKRVGASAIDLSIGRITQGASLEIL